MKKLNDFIKGLDSYMMFLVTEGGVLGKIAGFFLFVLVCAIVVFAIASSIIAALYLLLSYPQYTLFAIFVLGLVMVCFYYRKYKEWNRKT